MSTIDSNGSGTEAIRLPLQAQRIKFDAIEFHVSAGPDAGLQVSSSHPTLRIGTADDNDIILSDRAVSRHHAELRMTSEGILLRDLGSTNGTYVNQLRITEVYLAAETECQIGYTTVSIRQHTEERQVEIPRQQHALGELVGASEPMRNLYGYIRTLAPTPTTVLINGESGCGKELVARTLHELSGRSGPLVVFDASVTDPEMVRNDLFGHVKGAFTGAAGSREGAFRRADGGTLFIDEIGELPLDLQPRLLRALENREVAPIGSDQSVRVDVRVVAATHRNLEQMVQTGTFRADLYYRLSVVPLKVPPLRDIIDDIPLLVNTFSRKMEMKCQITPAAMIALQRYRWPGNVRELRNVLERAAIMAQGRPIKPEDLHLPGGSAVTTTPPASVYPTPGQVTRPRDSIPSQPPATQSTPSSPSASGPGSHAPAEPLTGTPMSRDELKEQERQMILETLMRNGNNKTAAARELGIPLSTLKRRIKDYQIS